MRGLQITAGINMSTETYHKRIIDHAQMEKVQTLQVGCQSGLKTFFIHQRIERDNTRSQLVSAVHLNMGYAMAQVKRGLCLIESPRTISQAMQLHLCLRHSAW